MYANLYFRAWICIGVGAFVFLIALIVGICFCCGCCSSGKKTITTHTAPASMGGTTVVATSNQTQMTGAAGSGKCQ